MPDSSRQYLFVAVVVAICLGAGGAVFLLLRPAGPASGEEAIAPDATVEAASEARAPEPEPQAQPEPPVVRSYIDVVAAAHPAYEGAEVLGVGVGLSDAAQIILQEPIYLCPRLDLWIIHPDAPPAGEILPAAAGEQIHLLRERVLFVHWMADEQGQWQAHLLCRGEDDESAQWVHTGGRQPLPAARDYRWDRAMSWQQRIIVPTATGVSIIRLLPAFDEQHQPLIGPDETAEEERSQPQYLLDRRGVLAWIPWEDGRRGSDGAARFVDGEWIALGPDDGWPERILHLVPMLDGSVLQLIANDDGTVQLALATLDPPEVDRDRIIELVDLLSDPLQENRQQAFDELTRYGRGVWPLLEELTDDQPAEARIRLGQLLRERIEPTLGGMSLVDGRLQVYGRHADGGALFHAPAGVRIPHPTREPSVRSPAWISIRPGRPIQLLPEFLARELEIRPMRLFAIRAEWIAVDETEGPLRFLGNHLAPLLREPNRLFHHPIGIDRRGRWLFRASSDAAAGPTLILDPNLADPTPRLPVWQMTIAEGAVGWTEDDWPVIQRGGAWVLEEKRWRPLDEQTETMITTVEAAGDGQAPDPIFTAPDGTRYFDGVTTLRWITPDGQDKHWPLPPEAVGEEGAVHLVQSADERLYLFNRSGRVVRLKATADAEQPWLIEAIFTRRIPPAVPERIWVDPAGRINIAYDRDKLAILFPSGQVPPEIALLMPAQERRSWDH